MLNFFRAPKLFTISQAHYCATMRRSTRLIQQADQSLFGLVQNPYVCRSCQRLLEPRASHQAPNQARHASSFRERFRRKLWKGEPPGREDPYDPSSPLKPTTEHTQEALARKEAAKASDPEPEPFEPFEPSRPSRTTIDKPATTWDGLEYIGSSGHWRERPETRDDKVRRHVRKVYHLHYCADLTQSQLHKNDTASKAC